MEQKSMTALISAFSRAYHSDVNTVKIFDDSIAKLLFNDDEYNQITDYMSSGISFFNPSFVGEKKDASRWIVDNQLSPSPLGRAAMAEKALQTAVGCGSRQYLIFAAGYDTFAYRQPGWASKLQIIEIDHPATSCDKRQRIKKADLKKADNLTFVEVDFTDEYWVKTLAENNNFDKNKMSFCSLLGITYYLPEKSFRKMISDISMIVPHGSTIVFDYPDENSYTDKAGNRAKKQAMLAQNAGETMISGYSYADMEKLLSDYGFLIYEHLTPSDITEQYFENYNKSNPDYKMTAFDNVNYCLAVKYDPREQ